jgi:hypothetical protein
LPPLMADDGWKAEGRVSVGTGKKPHSLVGTYPLTTSEPNPSAY